MSIYDEKPKLGYVHGSLLIACLVASPYLVPEIGWPGYLVVPLILYCGIVLPVPFLRTSFPIPRLGRICTQTIAATFACVIVTVFVLVSFDQMARPDVSALVARVPSLWLEHLVVFGVYFSIWNAFLEEAIFRWVLFDAVEEEWGSVGAILGTAALFGYGHLHGYPPGWVGAGLAGLFGLGLGLLRWWTGGLLLGFLVHIAADATIFTILARVATTQSGGTHVP